MGPQSITVYTWFSPCRFSAARQRVATYSFVPIAVRPMSGVEKPTEGGEMSMKRMSFSLFALFGAVLLAGCNRGGEENELVGSAVPLGTIDLTEGVDEVDLAAWLKLPREDLARRSDEVEKTLQQKEIMQRQGRLVYSLLPELRMPRATPIFREARYVPGQKHSMPPYVAEGKRDTAVALHLARHGDHEAAAQLVDPADAAAVAEITTLSKKKNYPLEWTRLVSLTQQAAIVDLASDNFEGAKRILAVQRQLRKLLDDETSKSPLGVVLLNRGLNTLKQAAGAWNKSGRGALSAQAEKLIGDLGLTALWSPTLPAGRDALAGVFGTQATGPGVIAASPMRALDLLDLPLPADVADTVVGFVDKDGGLAEVWVTYRPALEALQIHTAEQLAGALEDYRVGLPVEAPEDYSRRLWSLVDCRVTATVPRQHDSVGALVRLETKETPAATVLPRNFGPVSFDHTLEQNRRLTAWNKPRANTLVLTDKAMAAVTNPLPARTLGHVDLVREGKTDVLGRVHFDFPETPKEASLALGETARPLFASLGRPDAVFSNQPRGQVDLVWKDANTRYVLHFPQRRNEAVALEVTDVSGKAPDVRQRQARDNDAKDRLARIESKAPFTRLPRELEGATLGMSKEEFLKTLPNVKELVRRDIPGGVMAAFLGTPIGGEAAVREWFARFNDDRLIELRVRYADAPGRKPGGYLKKFDAIRRVGGAPETATLASAWAELPQAGNTLRHTWQDDLTAIVCRQEPFGLEVTLRDCPAASPAGVPLSPINYLGQGTALCKVGMTKSQLQRLSPKLHDGAFLVPPMSNEPYDAVLVWLDRDRVIRVVARHKVEAGRTATDAARALPETWGRESARIGWPMRQEVDGNLLQGLGSRDDYVRFRLFWRDDRNGVATFSEWKEVR
jgi:hypothetical protein